MIKRFLVPVLALAALGLPARASIVTYCDGNQASGCGQIGSAFSSVSGTVYSVDLTAVTQVPNGGLEDPISGLVLYDYPNQSSANISESGGVVTDTNQGIQIQLPANTLVFAFDLLLPGGANGATYTISDPGVFLVTLSNTGSSPSSFFFGAISTTDLTNITVTGPNNTTGVQISGVQLAGAGQAETPEVGTLLLIGAGLISMRWMKRLPKPRFFRSPQTI
jgi:hypothetical protein